MRINRFIKGSKYFRTFIVWEQSGTSQATVFSRIFTLMKTSEFSIILQSIERKNNIVLIFLDYFCLYEILNNKFIIIKNNLLIIPKISPHKNSTYLPTRQQQTDGRTDNVLLVRQPENKWRRYFHSQTK